MALDGPGHDVLTVDHRGLQETGTVCAAQDAGLSCTTEDGTTSSVDVTWIAVPEPGADLVDGGDHGWWEVDGSLLMPLDTVAQAVSEDPVTVNAAQAWDGGASFSLTSIGGLGAWPALALLGLLAAGLLAAVAHKRRREEDQSDS